MEQQLQATHAAGTLLHDRYLVEGLLGRGGFGAVYLVRDRQTTGKLIAMKELTDRSSSEKQRLLAECEFLQRLDHPSLPQVQGIFERNQSMYMLMEYIAGPNLEQLRKEQPHDRFPFAKVVTMIGPIIEAVTYLHQQTPPLMHRDIKPANIIVPENGERTVLVDFGIAKEYRSDATTTAVRHCSPGYSAPEQYSGMGTDLRADVYGLAATCYALLTGIPPCDALERMTKIASKGIDPLIPVSELAPDVPSSAVDTISRALMINYEKRFRTPAEFWLAFIGTTSVNANSALPEKSNKRARADSLITREIKKLRQDARLPRLRLTLALLLVAILVGSVLGFGAYALYTRPSPTQSVSPTSVARATDTPRLGTGDYPALAKSYKGTLDNILTHVTTNISLTNIQQNEQSFKGIFKEMPAGKPVAFSGVIDGLKHVLVNVPAQSGQPPLYFQGTISGEGNLVGNFCSVDSSGQCSGNAYGLWSVSPG